MESNIAWVRRLRLNLNPEVVKDWTAHCKSAKVFGTFIAGTHCEDIHTEGGTMLISDRGNPPHMEPWPRSPSEALFLHL